MNSHVIEKLQKIIEGGDWRQFLIDVQDDTVDVFGRYAIRRNMERFMVQKNAADVHDFSTLRVALSWCVADHIGNHGLGRDIAYLDSDIIRYESQIQGYQQRLAKKIDAWTHNLLHNRLSEARHQLLVRKNRLEKCCNLAKYFQLRGFSDEIARTQSIKSNRSDQPGNRIKTWGRSNARKSNTNTDCAYVDSRARTAKRSKK